MAKIVVFDLDGVILQSPSRETIPEINFWMDYWVDVDKHVPNKEMLDAISCFLASNIHILILTARPSNLLDITKASLKKVCSLYPSVCLNPRAYIFGVVANLHLMMRDRQATFDDWASNAIWKKEVIRMLQISHHVLFAIEDFKPNVQEMRKVVPVLSYEQFRGD